MNESSVVESVAAEGTANVDHKRFHAQIDPNVSRALDRLRTAGKDVTSKIANIAKTARILHKESATTTVNQESNTSSDDRSDHSDSEDTPGVHRASRQALGLIREAGKDMTDRIQMLALNTKTKISSKMHNLPHVHINEKGANEKNTECNGVPCHGAVSVTGDHTLGGPDSFAVLGDSRVRRSSSLLEYELDAPSPPSPQLLYDPQVLEYVSRASHLRVFLDNESSSSSSIAPPSPPGLMPVSTADRSKDCSTTSKALSQFQAKVWSGLPRRHSGVAEGMAKHQPNSSAHHVAPPPPTAAQMSVSGRDEEDYSV